MARIVEKDPDTDSTYTIDWTNQLGSETVSSSSWTLPAGVTETSSSNTTTTTTITLGGGTAGSTYELTNDVTLSDSSTLDASIYVYVKQQILDEVRALPITLEEVKHSLRVTTDDDDEYIRELLVAAVEYVESITGRDLINRTYTVRCRRFPSSGFDIEAIPTRSVARIRYYDADNALQTLATSVYSVYERPDGTTQVELAINQSWPTLAVRGDAVELLVVGGYGTGSATVPPLARTVIRMIVRHWYDNPAGAVTGTIFTKTEPAIEAILWNLKTGHYASV